MWQDRLPLSELLLSYGPSAAASGHSCETQEQTAMGDIPGSQSAGQNGLTYEARSKDYPGLTTAHRPEASLFPGTAGAVSFA